MAWHGHDSLATAVARGYTVASATTLGSVAVYVMLIVSARHHTDAIAFEAALSALLPLEGVLALIGVPVLAFCRRSPASSPALWFWFATVLLTFFGATMPAIRT
jgi:hypothetical protein